MFKDFEGGSNLLIAILVLVGTWYGVYLNMFDPSVFTGILQVLIPTYAAQSVGKKLVRAKKEKETE